MTTPPRRRPHDFMQVDGMRCWHDSNGFPHSEDDQPAITRPNGEAIWYRHGTVHRDFGPAHIHPDGREEWFHDGRKLDDVEVARLTDAHMRAQRGTNGQAAELQVKRVQFKKRLP